MMSTVFQVACGGAIGAVLRYAVVLQAGRSLGGAFPFGTLGVNIIGSLLMGLAVGWLGARGPVPPFLTAGILGGFTTFSAFSLDAVALVERGQAGSAAIYVLFSVLGAVLALFLGLVLGRGLGA